MCKTRKSDGVQLVTNEAKAEFEVRLCNEHSFQESGCHLPFGEIFPFLSPFQTTNTQIVFHL